MAPSTNSVPQPKFKPGTHPNSLANLRKRTPFTHETAVEASNKALQRRMAALNAQELANKAFESEEVCIKLARYTNAEIMADESLAPSIRLEASAPFLKRGNGSAVVQINIGGPLDRAADPAVGTGAAHPERAIVDAPEEIAELSGETS